MRDKPKPCLRQLAELRADWTVHYLEGAGERWVLDLGPRPDALRLLAQSRGSNPRDGEIRFLQLGYEPSRSPAIESLEAMALMHFGSSTLSPRIIGLPDWDEIGLVIYIDNGHGYEALVSLRLCARGDTLGVVLRQPGRHCITEYTRCGGDADPLYALLRVASATVSSGSTSRDSVMAIS